MDNREKKWPNEATARIEKMLRDPAVWRGIKIWVRVPGHASGPAIDGYEAYTILVRLWANWNLTPPPEWEEVDWSALARAINQEFNLR